MLDEFLTANRSTLIDKCAVKAALRHRPRTPPLKVDRGVPVLIDQLIEALRDASGKKPGSAIKGSENGEIKALAKLHGRDLLRKGFTVEQVVHGYGDLCQTVTEMATEDGASIEVDEFRILNRCLDDAIAGAVTEFSDVRDSAISNKGGALHERLGFLDSEMRRRISTAMLAVSAIRSGNVGLTGSTGTILDHSLISLRDLVDRSLADVRVAVGTPRRPEQLYVYAFIDDIEIAGSLEARVKGCAFKVSEVDPELMVYADRAMLLSAVGHLLHNAFRFTKPRTTVSVNAYASGDRILIDIEDQCGGHPPGSSEKLLLPAKKQNKDTAGLGLGLPICRRNVEANNGVLRVRDMQGHGCVFTIDLPRYDGDLAAPIH